MQTPIHACRICGGTSLSRILDLGTQVLTGVFPKTREQVVSEGPLRLTKCVAADGCGLVQLDHSYELAELYGDNYGYRSGLNASMVAHLREKVAQIRRAVHLDDGDLVIDIGSNDGTTLGFYPANTLRVGIDPSAEKFKNFYPAGVKLLPSFFTSKLVRDTCPGQKAKVVTSFSMFYDLEQPLTFMREVAEILADDGIWVFEQSYLPTMLARNSYDTVCHEHLEYYALKQIKWMADRAGLTILDVTFNDVNGGSISVVATKTAGGRSQGADVAAILEQERSIGLDGLDIYRQFEARVKESRERLRVFLQEALSAGRTVAALGASTKGNVLLQYCGLTEKDIASIGEVNPDKFGCFAPGSLIPIVDQAALLASGVDYLVVLPWHFRGFFDSNPAFKGQTLVYPLPVLDVAPIP